MIRLNRRGPNREARRARDEAVSAWDHLRAAANEGARRISDRPRRGTEAARERANNAAMALRGKTPRSTIRKWLGTGLAAGAMIGAAGAAMLGRRRHQQAGQEDGHADTGVREKAGTAMESVRERATTAAHKAATSARDTAAKLSEATKPREGNGHQSHPQNNRQSRTESSRTK
jgi:hypothetical protein